jgi:hypothetical protein
MLARYRVILFELQFSCGRAFVLGGSVKMTGTGTGYQLDFVSHDNSPFKP